MEHLLWEVFLLKEQNKYFKIFSKIGRNYNFIKLFKKLIYIIILTYTLYY